MRDHDPSRDSRQDRAPVDHRYGRIGIPAVAAALPYQSCAKNPAYAPVDAKPHDDTERFRD